MSIVGMPGVLKRYFDSFRNAIIYCIVYYVLILLGATYLGYLGSREPFMMFVNAISIILAALWLGFLTEYVRLRVVYRNTDFSKTRQKLQDLLYAIMVETIAGVIAGLLLYFITRFI